MKLTKEQMLQQGNVAFNEGIFAKAEGFYRDILKIQPRNPDANHNLGVLELAINGSESAFILPLFKLAIDVNPNKEQFWISYIDALIKKNQPKEAEENYKNAIKLNPSFVMIHYNIGIMLNNLGRFDEAEAVYKKVIKLKPNFVATYYNLGITLNTLGRFQEAEMNYKKAIELKPNYAEAYSNLGITLQSLSRSKEAEASLKKAIELKPDLVEAYTNLAITLNTLDQFEEAEMNYKKAIELKPNYAEAYSNLGITLQSLSRSKEAEASLKKAIELKPDLVEAYTNLAITLNTLDQFEEAEMNYKKAIELKPNYAEAYSNLGNMQKALKRPEEALVNYERAIALKPNMNYLLGALLETKMQLCMWEDLPNYIHKLAKKINNEENVSNPFFVQALIDNPDIHRKSSEIYSKYKFPKSDVLPKISHYYGHKKIRIGYFSPDFKNHSVSYLTAKLYEMHDREKFEIYAFLLGTDTKDEFSTRIKAGVDHFHDVSNMSDRELAMFARTFEIDIAVDLAGFTGKSRQGIFAMSVAPIQVGYIGYPGTMGIDYYDYLIADRTIIPEKSKKYYSENIIYLPCYQVNDTQNFPKNTSLRRQDFGISEDVFVFCCFNNNYKITPDIFDSWARILKQADQSVLMLYVTNETAIKNLKTEINNRGIDPNRLIFAKLLARPEYLARYQVVDLFLDTLPSNGGTTTSDALRMGVPVLTCIGESFASRMTASLLNSLDLPELITTTLEQYESLAIEFFTNSTKFNTLKEKLVSSLPTAQLYDNSLFTKHLETAYQTMNEKYKNGLNSGDIEVNN